MRKKEKWHWINENNIAKLEFEILLRIKWVQTRQKGFAMRPERL
jgi:hypothetical protein